MTQDRGIRKRGIVNQRYSAGIGYVIIPTVADRDAYVQKCLRTGMIGMLSDEGGICWNVQCNKHDLGFLEFPFVADLKDKASLGTAVIWVNLPTQDNPIVVSIVDRYDEGNLMKEHQFKFIREFDGGYVELSGRGDTGEIFINATNDGSGGSVNISATNTSQDAAINLFTKGDTNIEAVGSVNMKATSSVNITIQDKLIDENTTTINYVKGVGLEYNDEFGNTLHADSVDWRFNGGANNGLIVIKSLVEKINALENRLNQHVALYNLHVHTGNIGAPTTPPVASDTEVLTNTTVVDIENPDVKH